MATDDVLQQVWIDRVVEGGGAEYEVILYLPLQKLDTLHSLTVDQVQAHCQRLANKYSTSKILWVLDSRKASNQAHGTPPFLAAYFPHSVPPSGSGVIVIPNNWISKPLQQAQQQYGHMSRERVLTVHERLVKQKHPALHKLITAG